MNSNAETGVRNDPTEMNRKILSDFLPEGYLPFVSGSHSVLHFGRFVSYTR